MKTPKQILEHQNSRWTVISKYLKHQFKGVNAHGIHSPAVFALFNHLRSNPKGEIQWAFDISSKLKKDKTLVKFQDPGRNNEVAQRSISDIASKAGKRRKPGLMLHQLVSYFQPEEMLELGTSLGISALYQITAAPTARLTTIEGSAQIAEYAKDNLNPFGNRIRIVCGLFSEVIEDLILAEKRFDFIYLDGHHQKEPTLLYVLKLKRLLKDDGCIVLDDIYWSDGMEKAWEILTKDEEMSFTIDLFHYGVLWKKKGVEKQHFVLKC